MDQAQSQVSTQPTISSPSTSKTLWIFVGIILACLALTSAYLLGKQTNNLQENSETVSPTINPTLPTRATSDTNHQISKSNIINVVNMSALQLDNRPDATFFGFQIRYPSKYVVTTDEMITSYITQGGQAPPRMILTEGKQPLDSTLSNEGYIDYSKVLNGQQDCVAIWTTLGISSFNQWRDNVLYGKTVQVLNTKEEKHGKYTFSVEDVMIGSIKRTEALLRLPQNVTYYFHTCNMNNRSDLQFILDNLAVKGS